MQVWCSFSVVVVVLTAPHPGRAEKNAGRHEDEWIEFLHHELQPFMIQESRHAAVTVISDV